MPSTSLVCRMTTVAALALALALLVGCNGTPSEPESGEPEPAAPSKVVLVREIGESGAGSFNALAEDGLAQAAAEFELETDVVRSDVLKDYTGNVRQAAKSEADLVLTIGEWMMTPTSKVASDYQDTVFAGIDQPYRTPASNTIGLLFKEHEAAYLAGVVAGLCTLDLELDSRINKRNVVGFVGGTRIPLVERYEAGFTAGARSVNPTVTVLSTYVGSFDDAKRGRTAARNQISLGADIVFVAAGESGLGALAAIKDGSALMIGVETDQAMTLPGAGDVVLTSATKRVDLVVFETIKRFLEGTLEPGRNIEFGVAESGVGLAPFHGFEQSMPGSTTHAIEDARTAITDGSITVDETMAELE